MSHFRFFEGFATFVCFVYYRFIFYFLQFPFVCFQEASDHDEGEDADAEEDEYDLAGDETSEDSDSEELDDKGNHGQLQLFLTE